MQDSDEILTVLVLYNSTLHEAPAYISLSAALHAGNTRGSLFVYDNSPQSQMIGSSDVWTTYYVHDSTNPGVSKAYNAGFTYATARGLRWMMLVDQDTDFPVDIFDHFRRGRLADPQCGIFAPTLVDSAGIVSPFRQRLAGGRRLKTVSVGRIDLGDMYAINSGLLVSVNLFHAAGGYDERVRLDFSDVNFFRRLRSYATYFVVLNTVCRHTLSSSSTDTKLKDALNRFIFYVEGSRITGREFGNTMLFELYALLRAVKLSWKYRSLRFFGTLITGTA